MTEFKANSTNLVTIVAIVAIALLLLAAGCVSAQTARLEGNFLIVPEISTAEGSYRAQFLILTFEQPVVMELMSATPTTASGELLVASYSGNDLKIRQAQVNNISYWIRFRHDTNNRFTLLAFGENPARNIPAPRPFSPMPDWRQVPGLANDISVAANGDVWIISTNTQGGGFGIHQLDGPGGFVVEGGALRVEVDPVGRPWVVNDNQEIFRLQSNGIWERMPGFALDIGIGANGDVWAANEDGVYSWTGTDWLHRGGSGGRIDVGPDGRPWVVGFSNHIYTLVDSAWIELPGEAGDIGVGADGSVWVIGVPSGELLDFQQLQRIYHWNGTDWDLAYGDGVSISVGPDGQPWVTNGEGEIWRAR
ncbi:MAG: hypothetical protein OXE78_04355 [Gammaproteobacteria bacterium]|nr:hypothetical protein [Gammaproteobacteria bacterium]